MCVCVIEGEGEIGEKLRTVANHESMINLFIPHQRLNVDTVFPVPSCLQFKLPLVLERLFRETSVRAPFYFIARFGFQTGSFSMSSYQEITTFLLIRTFCKRKKLCMCKFPGLRIAISTRTSPFLAQSICI